MFNPHTQAPLKPKRIMALASGEVDIRQAMEDAIREENHQLEGELQGVSQTRMLVLSVQSPKVPTMAFLAMVSMSSWGNWSSSIARRPRAGQPFHAVG